MNPAPRGAEFIYACAGGNGAITHAAGGDRRIGPARGESAQGTRKGRRRHDVEFKPIETQEQFDEMVKERIERAKRSAVPEDYEDLKAKAAKLEELEEKGKTELQKAQEAAATAQRELESMRARAQRADLAQKIAQEKGVPVSLITGETQEDMERSADALIAWKTPAPAPKVKTPGAHDNSKQTGAADGYELAKRELAKAMFGGQE